MGHTHFPRSASRDPWRRVRGERGVVLPLTLMVLLVLATLVSALLAMGTAEPQIAANLTRGAQALGFAEGGAERGIAYLVANAATVQNACNPTCTATTPLWTTQPLGTGGTYTVTYQSVGFATMLVDAIGTVGIACAAQCPQRHVQAMVTAAYTWDDAIVGKHVSMGGNSKVTGGLGSIYGADDVRLDGSAHVGALSGQTCGTCTATTTGTTCMNCTNTSYVDNTGESGTGKPSQDVPAITPTSMYSKADYVLQPYDSVTKTGWILVVSTGALVQAGTGDFTGWTVDHSNNWSFSGGSTPPNGTYYVGTSSTVYDISISASPGTNLNPWQATFIANNLDIQGHPVIVPSMLDTLAIVNTALSLQGVGGDASLSGALMASGDVKLQGGVDFNGNIVSKSGTVDVSGDTTITYDKKTRVPYYIPPTVIAWSTLSQ